MRARLTLVLLLVQALSFCGAATFYVSPQGDDHFSGQYPDVNAEKTDGPFRTLSQAQTAVRKILPHAEENIVVQLRGGTHFLDETMVLTPQDCGLVRVIYTNYPGEEPIISSGVEVPDWRRLDRMPQELSAAARRHILVADIPADVERFYAMFASDKSDPDGLALEVPRARSQGFKPTQGAKEKGISITEMHYPAGAPVKNWANIEDVEIVIRPWCLWTMNILPLARVDESQRIAYTALEGTYPLTRERINRFGPESVWVENTLEALDEPGEWVVNTQTRKIYFWPKAPIGKVYVPKLRELIRIAGDEAAQTPAKNIVFRGLTFAHSDRDVWTEQSKGLQHDWEMYDTANAMLRFRWAENCVVDNCAFVQGAGTGIRLDLYAQNITIENNMIGHLGGTGIALVGYGPGRMDVNKNNRIYNNHIHHIGQHYWHNPALMIWQSGYNHITHNLMHHTPYNAIAIGGINPPMLERLRGAEGGSFVKRELIRTVNVEDCGHLLRMKRDVRWSDLYPYVHGRHNVIEYNEIHHALTILGDGNGIYIRMVPAGNIVRQNYLHDIDGFGTAIRADDDQFGCVISDNVIAECSFGGICVKRSNVVENNIIVNIKRKKDTTKDTVEEPAGYLVVRRPSKLSFRGSAPPMSNALLRRNILYHTYDYPPVFYTELNEDWPQDYYQEMLRVVSAAQIDENLLCWKGHEDFTQTYLQEIKDQRGTDALTIVADPMLVDVDQEDFGLQPNSPAHQLGIHGLDVTRMGLTGAFPHRLNKYK